uniref:Uncharacterized protein n=1 Tax=Acrobeloides nanus TaxID=290746 RepID=A0A914D1J0_9BILA
MDDGDEKWSNKNDCFLITGTLNCHNETDLVVNITVECWDEDGGLRGDDDLMASNLTNLDGGFILTACGPFDVGFDDPDPFLLVKHECNREHLNGTQTLRLPLNNQLRPDGVNEIHLGVIDLFAYGV